MCRRIGAFERELSSTVAEILAALGHSPDTAGNVASSAATTALVVP